MSNPLSVNGNVEMKMLEENYFLKHITLKGLKHPIILYSVLNIVKKKSQLFYSGKEMDGNEQCRYQYKGGKINLCFPISKIQFFFSVYFCTF